ncbi:MAG: sporulation protein YqfD [Clostridiales bacterium]|nr:sporulation protein YqfD [Clostridiales bacterium]
MFLVRLWNYFCGYAIITVKGIRVEKFINLAVINEIYLWDMEKLDYYTLRAKISIKDFFRIRDIVKRTNSSVSIQEKCGMPFKIKVMRKKKLLFFGLGALFIFLYILSSYIWMIEINGEGNIKAKVILDELSSAGLKVGIRKTKVDKRDIENKVLISLPELTWVGIEIKGTKAYVTVSERLIEPEFVNIEEPCNIIAVKNAVIEKILVLNGDGIVKDGDTVEKGQLLVTGIIERENIDTRYVHAMAKIFAKTWYEDVEEIALKQIDYKKSGRTKKIYSLEFLGKSIRKKLIIPYEDYNKSVTEEFIFVFGDYVFPIKLITIVFTELKPIEKYLDIETAKERCLKRLTEKTKLQYPKDAVLTNRKIEYFTSEESIIGKMFVEIIEDIARKKQIIEIMQ